MTLKFQTKPLTCSCKKLEQYKGGNKPWNGPAYIETGLSEQENDRKNWYEPQSYKAQIVISCEAAQVESPSK